MEQQFWKRCLKEVEEESQFRARLPGACGVRTKMVAMYRQENCPLEYFTICNKTVAAVTSPLLDVRQPESEKGGMAGLEFKMNQL